MKKINLPHLNTLIQYVKKNLRVPLSSSSEKNNQELTSSNRARSYKRHLGLSTIQRFNKLSFRKKTYVTRYLTVLLVLLITFCHPLHAQKGMVIGDQTLDNSAILELESTDRGLLMPRLTTDQRNNISGPKAGLLLYNTSLKKLNLRNGDNQWEAIDKWSQNTSNNSRIYYNGGNVGIGINNPSARLEVSNGTTGLQIQPGSFDGTANNNWTTLDMSGNKNLRVRDNFSVSNKISIGSSNFSEDAHLFVNGNVRVSDDADIFGVDQIVGFNDLRLYGDDEGGPDLLISPNGAASFNGPDNDGSTAALAINSGSQKMLLDGNEIDVNGTLYLNGNTDNPVETGGLLRVKSNNPNDGGEVHFGTGQRYGEYGGGNSLNESDDGVMLEVRGNSNETSLFYADTDYTVIVSPGDQDRFLWVIDEDDNTEHFRIDGDGNVWEASDRRRKKNIKTLDNALEKVMGMRGVSYDWIPSAEELQKENHVSKRTVGVIAQEMETIIPELVLTNEQGSKLVDYGGIGPILIEALKEQHAIVEQQQKTIETQQAQIDQLQQQYKELAEMVRQIKKQQK